MWLQFIDGFPQGLPVCLGSVPTTAAMDKPMRCLSGIQKPARPPICEAVVVLYNTQDVFTAACYSVLLSPWWRKESVMNVAVLLFAVIACWTVPGVVKGLRIGKEKCDPDRLAVYRIVLDTHWSRSLFPKQYPEVRPPAQWSKLVGRWRIYMLGVTYLFECVLWSRWAALIGYR